MASRPEEESDDASGVDPHAKAFGDLVERAGGPTRAAQILRRSRNTVDKWRSGQSRIPFSAVVQLADDVGMSLDAIAGREQPQPAVQIQSAEAALAEGFVSVPMLRVTASAGNGRFNADPTGSGEVVAFREEWLRAIGLSPGRTDALKAVGDSMEPTIRDGDILLIDRSVDRVVNDGIYVVVFGGAVLVKRVQIRRDRSIVLKSENSTYAEEIVPADEVHDLVVEGRVRWFGRTI